jgi:dipeptidyl-peptidase-4
MKMKINKTSKLLLCMFLFSSIAMAQQKKQFSVDDLVPGGSTFYNLQPENLFTTWWGNVCVKQDADACYTLSARDGSAKQLFSLKDLNKWAATTDSDKIHSCYNVSFPYAGKTLVRTQTKQEYLLVDWKAGRVVWRQPCKQEADNMDWNAASRNMAYTVGDNLFVTTADGRTLAVSKDGSNDLVYGKSVHRDEFGITKGTFWSPQGDRLAFYRMDQSMVPDYPQVNIDTRIATLIPDKYPMAGEKSHKVTVGIFNPSDASTVWLQAGDPTDRYFTNISWAPDGKKIYMIELNRDQNYAQLVAYDAKTGQRLNVIYEEKHPRYVEPLHGLTFLPWDSNKFIYQSQCDGYNHLYLFDLAHAVNGDWIDGVQGGKHRAYCEMKQLTKGKFVVLGLVGFNRQAKTVLIRSNELSPLKTNLFVVDVATGHRTLLGSEKGVHSASLSSDGSMVLDRYSAPDVTRSINLIATNGGKQTNLLTAADPWKDYAVPQISCGSIKAADGVTDLYYRMVKPAGFDPAKKYPTVVYVYGGPHDHLVDASRNYMVRGWEILMAQKGYLLFILDNRGSEDRGLEFENCTFRHLGDTEMQDQMKGMEFLKSLPYVDANRMGIHGWSFGGFMTINMMCTHPDVFKVGVAGGPVIDWQYYEVMYGERYMDTPQTNPEGFKGSNLRLKAKNLQGKLQIITGYDDNTCVQQHTLSFLRASIEAGKQVDYFTYPGDVHNMVGKDRIHLTNRIIQYFEEHLK